MRFRCTVTRFVGTDVFPLHGVGDRAVAALGWPGLRGRTVEIVLPPEGPDEGWKCGTPVVWRVSPEWLAANGFGPSHWVCVHQVEID